MAENIIASTLAREHSSGSYAGTFILTTERVLVIDADGVTVHYEARRSDIVGANQDIRTLTIFRKGEMPGTVFWIATPMAGPVRWEWYLDRPSGYTVEER